MWRAELDVDRQEEVEREAKPRKGKKGSSIIVKKMNEFS